MYVVKWFGNGELVLILNESVMICLFSNEMLLALRCGECLKSSLQKVSKKPNVT